MKARRTYAGAYAFRRLAKLAPYSAKERLRKAIIACHGNLIAVSVVIGYSPYSDVSVERWVDHFELRPEVVEARRRAKTRNRLGKPTKTAVEAREQVRRIIDDARRRDRIERKRAEIEQLLAS